MRVAINGNRPLMNEKTTSHVRVFRRIVSLCKRKKDCLQCCLFREDILCLSLKIMPELLQSTGVLSSVGLAQQAANEQSIFLKCAQHKT